MFKEETINLDRFAICGILTYGRANPDNPAMVLFSAGLIHRVGPNRLYVKLARELAQAGFPVFRVDLNGQGDSIHQPGTADIDEGYYLKRILDALEKKLQVSRFILAGLCSGADTAYRNVLADSRVSGLVMINGSGLNEQEVDVLYPLAQQQIKQRYYRKAAVNPRRWIKLVTGKSKLLNRNKLAALFTTRRAAVAKPGNQAVLPQPDPYRVILKEKFPLLVIISEGSIAYDLFHLVYSKDAHQAISYKLLPDTDHIISPAWAQQLMISEVKAWASTCFLKKAYKHASINETVV